jgi:hypothetical protein
MTAAPPDSADARPADLERSIAEKRAKRLATTPDRWKGHFVASWALKRAPGGVQMPCGSPRRAIKAFCLECVGFDRAAVTGCTAFACPLWNFRPFQEQAAR